MKLDGFGIMVGDMKKWFGFIMMSSALKLSGQRG